MPVIIASVTHCCWVISVVHILFPTWISIMKRQLWSMKRLPVRLVRIRYFIVISVVFLEDAIGLIVNGYAKEVLNKLPMEFAVEAQKLLTISLEGSVG